MDYNEVMRIVNDELWRREKDYFVTKDCPHCQARVTMLKVLIEPKGVPIEESVDIDAFEYLKCLSCDNLFKEVLEQVKQPLLRK